MFTPEKVGGTKQDVQSTLKSRGKCPPVHPRIYAHGLATDYPLRCNKTGVDYYTTLLC